MKVRNKSEEAQHFTGIGTFDPGETKDVDDATAEFLLKSPHMEAASMRGVEKESKSEQRRKNALRGIEAE